MEENFSSNLHLISRKCGKTRRWMEESIQLAFALSAIFSSLSSLVWASIFHILRETFSFCISRTYVENDKETKRNVKIIFIFSQVEPEDIRLSSSSRCEWKLLPQMRWHWDENVKSAWAKKTFSKLLPHVQYSNYSHISQLFRRDVQTLHWNVCNQSVWQCPSSWICNDFK